MPSAAPISSAWPAPAGPGADHFLQRDDVGVDVAQHLGDARRHRAAIHAAAAVDVVGRDAERRRAAGDFASVTAVAPGSRRTGRRSSPTAAAAASRSSVTSSLSREVALVVLEQPRRDLRIAHADVDLVVVLERPVVDVGRAEHRPQLVDDQHLRVRHRRRGTRRCGRRPRAARPTCAGWRAAPSADRCCAPARSRSTVTPRRATSARARAAARGRAGSTAC